MIQSSGDINKEYNNLEELQADVFNKCVDGNNMVFVNYISKNVNNKGKLRSLLVKLTKPNCLSLAFISFGWFNLFKNIFETGVSCNTIFDSVLTLVTFLYTVVLALKSVEDGKPKAHR